MPPRLTHVAEPQPFQVFRNGGIQPQGFFLLFPPLAAEAGHLLLEGFAVIELWLGAHVAAWGEDVPVLADFIQRCALAEAGYISVITGAIAAPPGVAGISDAGDVLGGQVPVGTVRHGIQLAGIDEQGFSLSLSVAPPPAQKPEAGRYLGSLPGAAQRKKDMKTNPFTRLFRGGVTPGTKLFAVTPQRTGERTLLGAANFLGSIAVPEPFSLEVAGDASGVSLLARCREGSFVRQQLGVYYPQARVNEVPPEEDPLRLSPGEQAWSMALRLRGPEYLPLRPFRDDDLLDPGSDGALSDLEPGERLVARLGLVSLGPEWSRAHQEILYRRQQPDPANSPRTPRPRPPVPTWATWPSWECWRCRRCRAIYGCSGGDLEGGAAGPEHGGGPGRGRLGLVAHQEGHGRGESPGPDPDQGEALPHRLPGPAGGHRRPA